MIFLKPRSRNFQTILVILLGEIMLKLFQTILDTSFHSVFEPEKYHYIAVTFHSSKGLELEQVIVFVEDYRLSDMASIYNHYVASTSAKTKLIIVKLNE